MSMHKIPLTQLEEDGLRAHGLDIGSPSQLSDVFRHGIKWALEQTALSAVTAERDRLQQFEAAYNEWHDKTEWVQKTTKAHELGKHRADVLKDRVDQLQAEAAGVTVRG